VADRKFGNAQILGARSANPRIMHDFEAKPLALVKAGHPSAFDSADADQYVKSAVVGFDQTIAFWGVEPSDGSKRHIASSRI
jgi:hypothetical protein